jgi:hypothetical protein
MDPGSHVEFQISTKNTNLVEDHQMNISGKFGSNLFSGFREEDLNVKSYRTTMDGRQTLSHDKTKAHMAYGQVS